VWDRPGIISRWLMWSHAAEHLVVDGRTFLLSNFEFNNAIDPHGYQHLTSFQVFPTGPFPGVEWVYRVGPAEMRKRLWLERARDTVAVQYDVTTKNHSPVRLQVWPLIACREASQLRRKMAGDWFEINTIANAFGLRLRTDREACLALAACPLGHNSPAQFVARPDWWYNFRYRQEAACGLEWGEDLYVPGSFFCEGHQNLTLRLFAEAGSDNPKDALAACRELTAPPFNLPLDNVDTETLLAASGEQFVVELVDIEGEAQPTIVAGYPWLESYGRDTCVALPTLLIDAGRADVAANVLTHMAGLLRDGLLPNHVVDDAAEHEYAAADEPLWFVYAADALLSARIDSATRAALLQNCRGILDAYIRGTRARSATTADPAIRMDPEDTLITCGGPNIACTWMDARFQARWITPRAGKPVEVNALWYHALRAVASRMRHAGASEWSNYDALADRVQASFRAKYWQEKLGYLADVVTDAGPDCALRPNQLLAASLPNSPLDPSHAARMLDAVTEHLLTPYGLRTLAPAIRTTTAGTKAGRRSAKRRRIRGRSMHGSWGRTSRRICAFRATRFRPALRRDDCCSR